MSHLPPTEPILASTGPGSLVPMAQMMADPLTQGRLGTLSMAALLPRVLGRFDQQAWAAQWHAARNNAVARVPFYCEAWCDARWNPRAPADDTFTVTEETLERQFHRFFPFAAPLASTWDVERRRYQDTTLAEALGLAGSLRPGACLVEIRNNLCDAPRIRVSMTNNAPAAFALIRGRRSSVAVRRLVWLSDEAILDPLTERNGSADWPDDRCRIPSGRPFTLLGRERDLVRWWAAQVGLHRPDGVLVKLSLHGDDPMARVRQRLLDQMPGLSATQVGFLLHHRVLGYLAAASASSDSFHLNWKRFHCAPGGRATGLRFSDLRRQRPAIINYRPGHGPVSRLLLARTPMVA